MKNLEINRTFANNLKKLREQHNLSLRLLAEQIGVSYTALSHYENCRRDPSIYKAKKIADFFSKTIDEMMSE